MLQLNCFLADGCSAYTATKPHFVAGAPLALVLVRSEELESMLRSGNLPSSSEQDGLNRWLQVENNVSTRYDHSEHRRSSAATWSMRGEARLYGAGTPAAPSQADVAATSGVPDGCGEDSSLPCRDRRSVHVLSRRQDRGPACRTHLAVYATSFGQGYAHSPFGRPAALLKERYVRTYVVLVCERAHTYMHLCVDCPLTLPDLHVPNL